MVAVVGAQTVVMRASGHEVAQVSGGVPPVLMWPFASARSGLGAVRGHSDPSLPPAVWSSTRVTLGRCWACSEPTLNQPNIQALLKILKVSMSLNRSFYPAVTYIPTRLLGLIVGAGRVCCGMRRAQAT
jgi:hypothetical protein